MPNRPRASWPPAGLLPKVMRKGCCPSATKRNDKKYPVHSVGRRHHAHTGLPDHYVAFPQSHVRRGAYRVSEITKLLSSRFTLSDAELTERIPRGQSTIFENRVGWARTYLKKAGLIELVLRGQYRITARGLDVKSQPSRIDAAFLKQFPEFVDFVTPKSDGQSPGITTLEPPDSQTPLEVLEGAYQRLRKELADELLQIVRAATPGFFERLVVDLLVKMGYGGSQKDAGQAVGRTGDDGVDGIIKEDRLGLDAIYIQAKRWEAAVGRPEVQAFAGSLEGHRARKGVFIATSQFSKEAREYVTRIEKKIVLVDGEQLAQLMMDFDVGVTGDNTYNVKKLDRDYFEE
jgi:restriction system protein